MKKLAILSLLLILLFACAPAQPAEKPFEQIIKAEKPVEKIVLGASLPLTGEAASVGNDARAGMELALKEVNDEGGINGKMLEIKYEDDKCSKEGITTITKLITADNVNAIIGPLCSAAAGPGLPVAQEAGMPTIIFASAPHLTKIGDFIFRIYPSDAFGGKFVAEYVYNTLGKKNAAIVYVKNDWGQGLHDTFVARFAEIGGKVVFDDSLNQDESDARTLIAKLIEAKPDVIVAPLYPAVGVVFIKQAKEAGVKAPILGGDAFDSKEVIESGVADDVKFAVPSIKNPAEFADRVKKVTGKDSSIWTPLGYDAVKIFAQVIQKVGTDKKAIRDELAALRYEGVSSTVIEFDADGDLKAASYDVKLIKDNNTTIMK